MHQLFTRARAEAWRAAQPQPAPKPRRTQRLAWLLLTILVAPFLLLGFLVVGELPHLKP